VAAELRPCHLLDDFFERFDGAGGSSESNETDR